MSKIELDKFIREMFRGHEKSSSTYTPEHWKNFEQLLDRETAKRKKGGFSMNNILFFSSAFVLVMLIPLLFLRSDTVSSTTEESLKSETKTIDISPKINDNNTLVSNNGNPNGAVAATTSDEKVNSDKIDNTISHCSSDNFSAAENNTAGKNEFDFILPLKMTQIDSGPVELTSINFSKIKREFKPGDTNDTKKRGKIRRSKLLMPYFYYNGF